MSVRRLAKEQPESFAFSKDTKSKAEWWIKKYPDKSAANLAKDLLKTI